MRRGAYFVEVPDAAGLAPYRFVAPRPVSNASLEHQFLNIALAQARREMLVNGAIDEHGKERVATLK